MKEAPIIFSFRILTALNEGNKNKEGMMRFANIPNNVLNKYLSNLVDKKLVKCEKNRSEGFGGGRVICFYTLTASGLNVLIKWKNCLSEMGLVI